MAMSRYVRFAAAVALTVLGLVASAGAQTPQITQSPDTPPTWIPDIKFASGREIVPYFEGWIRNPDDSFDFIFGYYNRNQEQELVIPAGQDNTVMPGGPDRGQPTFFLAKRQSRIYRVRVPKDWGDKPLTWTLTANGHTEKVVARLIPAYEKSERMMVTNNSTGTVFGEDDPNKPPTIATAPTLTGSVSQPVVLMATVTDDGLPKPRPAPAAPKPAASQSPEAARFQSQRNSSGGRQQQVGTRVTWLEYRGPGKVTFDAPTVQVIGDKATTNAKFSAPGTYTLFATASDGKLSTRTQVVVTVK
jgi:hypothetical protein